MLGKIYKIIFNNSPVYVGQTIKNLQERWNEHRSTGLRTSGERLGFAIHAAMRKYGVDNFSISLIEEVEENLLNEREKFWIKKLHTHISENGYNLTWGGEYRPDYIKTKCYQYNLEGNFLKEFPSITEAARIIDGNHENILKVMQGKLRIAYGFRWSYLKLDKLEPLPNNYTGSSKIVYQYDLNYNLIRQFNSTKEAARYLNKSQGNISSAANGQRKTAYGFIWSYTPLLLKAGY